MSFLDLLRGMVETGRLFKGGRCPRCNAETLLVSREGLMVLQCGNCVWAAPECARCDGSGFEGYDSKCCDCGTSGLGRPERCPTCGSPAPRLHPATQHEGECQLCLDEWHGALNRGAPK